MGQLEPVNEYSNEKFNRLNQTYSKPNPLDESYISS
jgi:hypothetical protein